jgi:aminoglycoside 3-N-acetyltransferase
MMTTEPLFPLTSETLARQFSALGLSAGQTVLVHSSMKHIGHWVIGGAEAVIDALMRILGENGTLMMPTHTTDNTDPANWQHPPVPEAWWQTIRDHIPPFNPATTQTRQMGIIPEQFRRFPGVVRSEHPVGSFAAWGKHAAYLTTDHHYNNDMFGEASPIGKLYRLDGYILMLGSGHANNTSLHLAEYRATFPRKRVIREGSAVRLNGVRCWVEYDMMSLDTDDFEEIGAAYEESIGYLPGKVGQADARFLRQRPLVDFAVQWMEKHRH